MIMILVTGATGLVGSHLILHLLKNQKKVRAIFRTKDSKNKTLQLFKIYNQQHLFEKIDWIQADVNDIPQLEIAFQNIEEVYHCAAKVSFQPKDEEEIRKVNIEGTANIVNFCLAYKVKKVCFVSSIAALGDLPENIEIITEENNWNPEKLHSDYAISKYGAEMEIWRGQQEGLNVVIVNPGIIFGSGFSNDGSSQIITSAANGLKYYPKGASGFIGVNDVVEIMLKLMENNLFGERYILVSENLSYKKLFEIISEKSNVKPPEKLVKPWQTEIIWRLDWLVSAIFRNKRKMPMAIAKSIHTSEKYSNEKIKSVLDHNFKNIEEVLAEIIRK